MVVGQYAEECRTQSRTTFMLNYSEDANTHTHTDDDECAGSRVYYWYWSKLGDPGKFRVTFRGCNVNATEILRVLAHAIQFPSQHAPHDAGCLRFVACVGAHAFIERVWFKIT